jgi:UTP:GlnB (protein PII) uridylyltransferase
MGLDVQFARIATYGHQVLDVFYVTDSQGRKIHEQSELEKIESELEGTIKSFLEADPK